MINHNIHHWLVLGIWVAFNFGLLKDIIDNRANFCPYFEWVIQILMFSFVCYLLRV